MSASRFRKAVGLALDRLHDQGYEETATAQRCAYMLLPCGIEGEIRWAGDGDVIAHELSEAGLDVYWDGTPAAAMVVRLPPWLPLYRMGKRER